MRKVAIGIMLARLFLAPVLAQINPPTTTFRSNTRLVMIEVIALGADGNPVSNLAPKDFMVRDNKKEQRIGVFASIVGGNAEHLNESGQSQQSKVQGYPASTIILLDTLNVDFPDQAYARYCLWRFLERTKANDRIAIFELGTTLKMLKGFRDPIPAEAVIRATNVSGTSRGAPLPNGNASAIGSTQNPALTKGGVRIQQEDSISNVSHEEKTTMAYNRQETTVSALRLIAKLAAYTPGRKNLIWLAGSFYGFSLGIESGKPEFANHEADEVARFLAEARIAVYPIDGRGMVVTFPDATVGTPVAHNSVNSMDRVNPYQVWSEAIMNFSFALAADHTVMDVLATDTGGKAFYNRNDIDQAISDSMQHASSFYEIGFYPRQEDFDGRWHTLEVQTKRKDVHLTYRRAYFADPNVGATRA